MSRVPTTATSIRLRTSMPPIRHVFIACEKPRNSSGVKTQLLMKPRLMTNIGRTVVLVALGCFLAGSFAQAHVTYSGRDLGSYSGLTNGTATITNQTVTGNYGWADAADGIL